MTSLQTSTRDKRRLWWLFSVITNPPKALYQLPVLIQEEIDRNTQIKGGERANLMNWYNPIFTEFFSGECNQLSASRSICHKT